MDVREAFLDQEFKNSDHYIQEVTNRTFKYCGVMLWNQLSDEEKTAESLYMFNNYIST